MALFRDNNERGEGGVRRVHKRLSFDSPVRERAQSKRFQFDTSSEEEEEAVPLQGELDRLCFDLKHFSPCRTRSGIVYDTKDEDEDNRQPPPIFRKAPVSRLSLCGRTSPSPPSRSLRALQLSNNFNSFDSPSDRRLSLSPPTLEKSANINPFTSEEISRKRNLSRASTSSSRSSVSSLDSSYDLDSEDEELSSPPTKRIRVSEVQVSRYEEEFLELAEIAAGEFGRVTLARHRLDGIVYAIKITKDSVAGGSHAESMAMNEVFAHAVLIKHKHVVRYYNSWVEEGRVYIQNEFCEGGSLGMQVQAKRVRGEKFSEQDLRRLLADVLKGLKYIHSKGLAHLDIKPDNVFITKEKEGRRHRMEQTSDLGDTDEEEELFKEEEEEEERVCYKIGDLGHVAPVQGGDFSPEEGDCRYMAPEFLEMEVDRSRLTKADIFSLGLTIYEAASLRVLPRNSTDSQDYEQIKRGKLPYMQEYSEEFNQCLASMVREDSRSRPSARALLSSPFLLLGDSCRSRRELGRELRETREKLRRLEQMMNICQ